MKHFAGTFCWAQTSYFWRVVSQSQSILRLIKSFPIPQIVSYLILNIKSGSGNFKDTYCPCPLSSPLYKFIFRPAYLCSASWFLSCGGGGRVQGEAPLSYFFWFASLFLFVSFFIFFIHLIFGLFYVFFPRWNFVTNFTLARSLARICLHRSSWQLIIDTGASPFDILILLSFFDAGLQWKFIRTFCTYINIMIEKRKLFSQSTNIYFGFLILTLKFKTKYLGRL